MRFRRSQQGGFRYPLTLLAVAFVTVILTVDGSFGHGYTSLGLLVVGLVLLALEWPWFVVAVAAVPVLAFTAVAPFDPHPSGVAETVRMGGIVLGAAVSIGISIGRVRKSATLNRSESIAEAAQLAIMPPVPARLGQYAFSVSYHSAVDGALVGGDFFKVVATPYGVRLIIGDVMGKGLDAVRMSAVVLGTFRDWAPRLPLPELVAELDSTIAHSHDSHRLVTAIVANLDDERWLEIANCGHPSAVRVTADHRTDLLVPSRRTTPLGMFADPVIERLQLAVRDRVFFYTDGLLEAHDRHNRLDLDEVLQVIANSPFDAALTDVLGRVRAAVSGPRDDIAMVLVECREPSAEHPTALASYDRLTGPWWRFPPHRDSSAAPNPALPFDETRRT